MALSATANRKHTFRSFFNPKSEKLKNPATPSVVEALHSVNSSSGLMPVFIQQAVDTKPKNSESPQFSNQITAIEQAERLEQLLDDPDSRVHRRQLTTNKQISLTESQGDNNSDSRAAEERFQQRGQQLLYLLNEYVDAVTTIKSLVKPNHYKRLEKDFTAKPLNEFFTFDNHGVVVFKDRGRTSVTDKEFDTIYSAFCGVHKGHSTLVQQLKQLAIRDFPESASAGAIVNKVVQSRHGNTAKEQCLEKLLLALAAGGTLSDTQLREDSEGRINQLLGRNDVLAYIDDKNAQLKTPDSGEELLSPGEKSKRVRQNSYSYSLRMGELVSRRAKVCNRMVAKLHSPASVAEQMHANLTAAVADLKHASVDQQILGNLKPAFLTISQQCYCDVLLEAFEKNDKAFLANVDNSQGEHYRLICEQIDKHPGEAADLIAQWVEKFTKTIQRLPGYQAEERHVMQAAMDEAKIPAYKQQQVLDLYTQKQQRQYRLFCEAEQKVFDRLITKGITVAGIETEHDLSVALETSASTGTLADEVPKGIRRILPLKRRVIAATERTIDCMELALKMHDKLTEVTKTHAIAIARVTQQVMPRSTSETLQAIDKRINDYGLREADKLAATVLTKDEIVQITAAMLPPEPSVLRRIIQAVSNPFSAMSIAATTTIIVLTAVFSTLAAPLAPFIVLGVIATFGFTWFQWKNEESKSQEAHKVHGKFKLLVNAHNAVLAPVSMFARFMNLFR